MRKIFIFIGILFACYSAIAQDYSNKGKEFWIAYPSHIDGTDSYMAIYLTGDQKDTATVKVGTITKKFSITPNKVTRVLLGASGRVDFDNGDVYLTTLDDTIPNTAIKVTSNIPIVAYAHIIKSARSGATLVLPTQVLGTEYMVTGYPSGGNPGGGGTNPQQGEFVVIATQPNTTISFTPTINCAIGSKIANNTYSITLRNAGDCYQFHGKTGGDISGTIVKSISTTTGGCKPIAVFAASTWSAFDCSNSSGGDNLYQQLFPMRSWGKKFITSPFIYREYDVFRIYIKTPGTTVKVIENGVQKTLPQSQYSSQYKFYEISTKNPLYIEADDAICVTQFMTSTTCSNGCRTQDNSQQCYGDPEMIVLNPIEQTLKNITFYSADASAFTGFSNITNVEYHYVNIIIDKNYKNTVKIDGAAPAGVFIDIPGTNYSYLQEDVTRSTTAGSYVHTAIGDTGFTAIVYGTGRVESYGYNGGTNVLDLYQYISIRNQNATVNFPATCKNTPFNFSITLPYQPLKLNWDFGGNANLSPNTNITNTNPAYDSSFIKDGKTLYVYKLPAIYQFTQAGTYPVKVIVNNPTTDGCNGEQEISYEVQVFDPPSAGFNISSTGCLKDTVKFTSTNTVNQRPIIKYWWNFGDGAKDSVQNTTHAYTPGLNNTFNVDFKIINDIGCEGDSTKILQLYKSPTAAFTVSNPACEKQNVIITDGSVANDGVLTQWNFNMGDGKTQSFTSSFNTFNYKYDTAGIYKVRLQTTNSKGCTSDSSLIATVTVTPSPVAGFILPEVCLNDAYAQFFDTSTIKGGANNFSYQWNFGDKNATASNPNTSILQNPKHSYTNTGVYKVKVIVTDNNGGCVDSVTKDFVVNGATPKANYTIINPNALCSNDTVTLKNASSVDFGSITKIEIHWDTANDLSHYTLDKSPKPNKIYKTIYNKFTTPVSRYIYVKMISYSGETCKDSFTQRITLVQAPKVQILPIKSICKEATPRIINEASDISGIAGFATFTGTGITNASTGLFNPNNLTANQKYAIKFLYTTSNFNCKDSATDSIKVLPSPQAIFATGSILCEKNNISFIDNSIANAGSIIQWKWNYGNNDSTVKSNGNPYNYIYNAAGSYNTMLTVKTDSGCVNSTVKTIIVNPLPKVNFILPNGICLPAGKATFKDSTIISGNNQTPFAYKWFFNVLKNNDSSTLAMPTYYYTKNDTPTVRLIVTSAKGCTDSADKTLNNIYPQPKAAFTVLPDTFVCISNINHNNPLSFYDKSNGVTASITNWFWTFGNQGTSSQKNPVFLFTDSGDVKVALFIQNANDCYSDTAVKNITVHPYPIIKLPKLLNFYEGSVLTIKPLQFFAHNPTFKWVINNNDIVQDSMLMAQVYPKDDKQFKLTVTAQGNCADADTVRVVVLRLPGVPSAFSPNGDGINDDWQITNLDKYPGSSVQVFDRFGRLVFESRVGYSKPWNGKYFNTGDYVATGVYYYIINPQNGRSAITGYVSVFR